MSVTGKIDAFIRLRQII